MSLLALFLSLWLATMPVAFMFSLGDCCGCGSACQHCDTTIPATLTATISGVTSNACDCTNFDGTYVLDHTGCPNNTDSGSANYYLYVGSSVCPTFAPGDAALQVSAQFNYSDTPNTRDVQVHAGDSGGSYLTWRYVETSVSSAFECNGFGPQVLTDTTSGFPRCTTVGSTATVST